MLTEATYDIKDTKVLLAESILGPRKKDQCRIGGTDDTDNSDDKEEEED